MDSCTNLNHRRADAPVRACPQCGEVVNARLLTKACAEAAHVAKRRNRDVFCVDCGLRLREPGYPHGASRPT